MTFTFTNYAAIPPQHSPFHNLISNILSGYEQGTKLRYLQPNLQEELLKKQQENQWYAPEKKSEIGLRGAQAGHYGALTNQTNIQNKTLGERLAAELQAAKLKAQQEQYFNQLLQRRLSGQSGKPGQLGQANPGLPQQIQQQMLQPEYTPGQGQAPFDLQQEPQPQQVQQPNYEPGQRQAPMMEQQPSPLLQQGQQQPEQLSVAEQAQQQPQQMQQQGAPQLTEEDILNKHFFKIDTFTPKYKAYVDSVAKSMQKKEAEKFKLDAQQDLINYKEMESARTDLPVLKNALQSALRMKEIIEKRPAFWGHYLIPGYFSNTATDELAGEFQSKLVPQMAAIESQLSNRGNQLALKISESKLPGFANSQQVALGKVNGLIDEIQKRLGITTDIAGGNIKKIGGRRFKNIDGEWYELDKGQ